MSESFERTVVLYGDKTMAEQLAQGDIASAGEPGALETVC